MKIIHYSYLVSFMFFGLSVQSQSKDSSTVFKVFGVCEMCKERIEAGLKIKGIHTAEWNINTKLLSLSFDPNRISLEKIHNKIAILGHDTELKKTKDAVYNALPKCCRYREFEFMMHSELDTTIVKNNIDSITSTTITVVDTSSTEDLVIKGVVLEEDNKGSFKPLEGANVSWLGTNIVATTDQNGAFQIKSAGQRLIISYTGYKSDTISVIPTRELKIILASGKQLNEVKVTANRPSTYINRLDPFGVRNITQKELFKAACCNLSESFETNPAVDVSYSDAVTGSKQIQLLGLAGIYTQLTVENLPGPRGLATAMGLNTISGTFIESIQLSKGTGSVANGYESIAGQINVELKKPFTSEKLYANLYVNDFGRLDANLNLTSKLGKKWSTTLLLHNDILNNRKLDFNNDGFRDLPTGNLFSAVNRWSYDNSNGLMSQFGVKFLDDTKTGGQLRFDPETDKFTTKNYGLEIQTRRIEGFGKIGYVFPQKKYKSLGLQLSAFQHEQNSYFGMMAYDAKQENFYSNFIYQSIIGTTAHKFRTGISFLYDNYDERFQGKRYERKEAVPGAFFEYTFTPSAKFDLVAGIREDHNSLYGWFTSPRLNLRYEPVKGTVIRGSIGRGQRTANIFAENNGVFVSSRSVNIMPSISRGAYGLKPEVAWNKGITFDQKFMLFKRPANIILDFFRNDFTDQVIVDIEDPRVIKFYNLDGKSFSNSFQAELSFVPVQRLDVRLAYRMFDVKSNYSGQLLEKPFTSRHRGFANLAYEVGAWKFDYTISYSGKKRLPSTVLNPSQFHRPMNSPSFATMNAQVSKTLGKKNPFDIYLGGENLTGYIQRDAIISSADPFNQYFDASMIWGPLTGRMIYAGVRYRIK